MSLRVGRSGAGRERGRGRVPPVENEGMSPSEAAVAVAVPVLGWTPPQGWPAALTEHLGMELWRIPVVVLSAVGIYLTALVLLRVFGARLITGLSVFDTVVALMFGAVAGRVILGHPPTLAAGVVGLTTLALLETVFGAITGTVRGARTMGGRARVIVARGRILADQARRGRVTRGHLNTALRAAGVRHLGEVQAVILEASGRLSVIRAGEPIDLDLLGDAIGAEHLHDDA